MYIDIYIHVDVERYIDIQIYMYILIYTHICLSLPKRPFTKQPGSPGSPPWPWRRQERARRLEAELQRQAPQLAAAQAGRRRFSKGRHRQHTCIMYIWVIIFKSMYMYI